MWKQKTSQETLGVRGDGGLDVGRGRGGDTLCCSLKEALS